VGEVRAAGWRAPIPLETVYSLNPMLKGLDEKFRPQILGAHGALWADQFIHGTFFQEIQLINENRSEKYFDYLTFPRMPALAEVCWTPLAQQNYDSFEKRLSSHYNRFDNADFGYRVPVPKLISNEKVADGYIITVGSLVKGAEIRYATDGIRANAYSPLYTGPVKVNDLKDFSAITVVNRNVYSLPLYFPEKYEKFQKEGQLIGEWNPSNIKGQQFSLFEMNASGKINGNGEYQVSFWFTDGSTRLDIRSLEVYKNGVKVTEDIHEGRTGSSNVANLYKFKIDNYETGAVFTLKASIRGDINNDSNGAVFIKKL
jgi:hexosaminidase